MRRRTRIVGYRCTWTHPNGRDRNVGELWDTRADAEGVAETLRVHGMLDVRVIPWHERSGDGDGE